jgi:hypothetical protein
MIVSIINTKEISENPENNINSYKLTHLKEIEIS